MTSRASRHHTKTHPLSPRSLASAIVLAFASLSANVDAAGLGRLNVQSALGQPLRAEVEVTSLTREEAQSLSARLAPPEAFRQAGLEYNPALASLRFAIEPRGGRTFVRITSTQPINEPFVDLLVELNWATGKFVREYTFLLDPPEMRSARTEPVEGGASRTESVAPAAVPEPPRAQAVAPAPVLPAPAAPAPTAQAPTAQAPTAQAPVPQSPVAERPAVERPAAPVERPAAQPARPAAGAASRADAQQAGATVDVRRGDTLGNIARANRPEGISLDQAMIAIYRANPSAFLGNVNLVKEGARLAIPDRSTMAAVDAAAATREVRMQSADFAAYRARLAGAARTLEGPRSGQTAAGSVGGRVEDRSAAAGGDQLRLSKPGTGAGDGAAVGSQSSRAGAAERDVARANALREANSRIADLEKNVGDLQKLVELKNRSMADLQKQLDEARAASKSVTGQVAAAPPIAPAAKVEPPKVEPPKADAPKAEPPKAEAPKAEAPKVEAPKVEAPKAEAPKAEAPSPAPAPAAGAPKPPPAAAPAKAPVAEPSFVDDLLENPFLLPGIGGIALLGAGYGWYAMRRRRRVEKFEDSLIAADAFASNSLFGSTGGQSVDTSNSVFAPRQGNAAVDVQSTEVDPIAEADVYIAYGREAQAEEILKEALKRQPERQAIRTKLLEIYSGRKDGRSFETLAREMHEMTGGRNEEWPKVVTMGLSLDPTNPLYGGAGPASAGSGSAGSGSAGAATAAAAAAATAAAAAFGAQDKPSAPEMPDLSFGVDAPPSASKSPPAGDTIEMAAAAVSKDDDFPSLDFDLNLDTRIDAAIPGGARGADGRAEPVPGDVRSAGLGTGLETGFDLPSLDLEPRTPPSAQSLDTVGSIDLDLPALESLTQTAKGSPELDLSPISLDLEPATIEADEAEAGMGGAGRWQEMATKLDLASAYEEIGDKEGARELLQEVIKGGDSGQQQKARAMLSKIG